MDIRSSFWGDFMPDHLNPPVYAKIALDLAGKIAAGELKEGKRISGRSLLAGQYGVSPETIRRSVQLLEDMEIVGARTGSGITIISRQLALKYVERYRSITDIRAIRDEIRQLRQQRDDIDKKIGVLIDRLEEQAGRLQNVRPIYPSEIEVPSSSPLLGKTISESKFWQNTGATIVAIQRDDQIILSPGPYQVFAARDRLFLTGDAGVEQRAASFLQES